MTPKHCYYMTEDMFSAKISFSIVATAIDPWKSSIIAAISIAFLILIIRIESTKIPCA